MKRENKRPLTGDESRRRTAAAMGGVRPSLRRDVLRRVRESARRNPAATLAAVSALLLLLTTALRILTAKER